MLRQTLSDARYEVIEAADGNEGLRLFHEQTPALVITDAGDAEEESFQTHSERICRELG